MNNPTFICKTDADFLLKTFCFKDGVAFFYGKIKNGIIVYFVNDGRKVHGPFEVCPITDKLYYPDDLEKLSFRDFEWYIPGEEYDKKSEEKWHNTWDELGEIANQIAKITPESEYDESTHILTYYNSDGTTKEQYFITNAKKYGPYAHIFPAFYKNENNFQFIFRKKIPKNYRSPKPNYYYNYNGKEFKIGKETPCFFYDPKEHAILQQSDLSYIIIDDKKMDFFNGECSPCSIRTDGIHTLITGKDKSCNFVFHYILDGVEHIIHTDGEIYHCDCESVTYFSNHKIWYHNETQISVPIPGSNSEIIGSAVKYEKQGIPYILLKGKSYNGTQGFLNAQTQGFVYLSEGAIYFKEYNYPTLFFPKTSPQYQKSHEENLKDIHNNYKTLASEHRLAGE